MRGENLEIQTFIANFEPSPSISLASSKARFELSKRSQVTSHSSAKFDGHENLALHSMKRQTMRKTLTATCHVTNFRFLLQWCSLPQFGPNSLVTFYRIRRCLADN